MLREKEGLPGWLCGVFLLLLTVSYAGSAGSGGSLPPEIVAPLQVEKAGEGRFDAFPEVARRETILPGGAVRRERIVRTSERYPYIRMKERIERGDDGELHVVAVRATAADHLMLHVTEGDKEAVLAVCENLGLKLRRWVPGSSVLLVETENVTLDAVDDAMDLLRLHLWEGISVEADEVFFPVKDRFPNDPFWNTQWNLERIQAPTAWGASTGSSEVVVAIVDTGARLDHMDLAGNLWHNPEETPDGKDSDGNGYIDDIHGYDFVRDAPLQVDNDTVNHGTHVAGTAGAVGNNGEGIAGVAWNVRLIILRAGESAFLQSDLIEAIDYVTALKRDQNVNVVASNHSYGGQGALAQSTAAKAAIARHRDAGILFVAAAGNEGEDNDELATWPANYDLTNYPSLGDWNNVISVAASDRTDGKPSFSNFGSETVHLAAPGVRILSTAGNQGAEGYATFSGTSMAAPHVTGAAALVKAANMNLDGRTIREILLGSVDVLPAWESVTTTGGRLNLARAVDEARRYPEVRITSPGESLFLGEGSDLVILADAGVSGEGVVTHVSFYADDVLVGNAVDEGGSWSFTWEEIPGGSHTLTAVASAEWEGETRTTTSEPVHIGVGEVKIDDADSDSVVFSGAWQPGNFDDAVGGSAHFFYRPRQTTGPPPNRHPGGADGSEFFRFSADLPDEGEWEVEMWWPEHPDAYEATPVEVFHSGGSTMLILDQRENSGHWNSLGAYHFSTYSDAAIVVRTVESQNYMLADAVRFSRTEERPAVSVVATGPIASAREGAGMFTFTRTQAKGSLDVAFSLRGDAREGEDYSPLERSVTFPDGAHKAFVSVVPMEEPGFGGERSIILELDESDGYRVTTPSEATVLLVAPQAPVAPVVKWPTPSPIVYGTPLDERQLNAWEAGGVPGAFIYAPGKGAVLEAGEHDLQVTFFPDDEDRYTVVTKENSLVIEPALLEIIAEDKQWEPGNSFPELTMVFKGFVNGEGEADLESGPVVATPATTDAPPGTYPIYVSGAEGGNYTISFFDGILTITEISFGLWASRHFEEEDGETTGFDVLDTSGDGVPNLLKYALDLDPLTPSVSLMSERKPGLPLLHRGKVYGVDHLFLTYRRNPAKTDISYSVESSAGLSGWRPLDNSIGELIASHDGIEVRQASIPIEEEQQFLRLKITRLAK